MRAFLGTGLLGTGFVQALLERGEKVHVWNRTASKAKALESDGATAFDSPEDAFKGADIIHLALKDDRSVDEVLEKASPGLKPGATIIDHTTASVDGAVRRTERWKQKGIHYLHAPVLMGPKNARERTGIILVSGDQPLLDKFIPVLEDMTGRVMNYGAVAGRAAGMKLAANLFLIALNGGIGDMVTMAGAAGISMEELQTLFADWNPGVAVSGRLKKVDEGDFSAPSWELTMARKDAGLMIAEAESAHLTLPVISAIAGKMDELIAQGAGQNDWSIIARKPKINQHN